MPRRLWGQQLAEVQKSFTAPVSFKLSSGETTFSNFLGVVDQKKLGLWKRE